ncbi:PPR domain-containing protein/PPR_2 domain-containing protein/PPR_3 domain-containing protein [Cephalotus follicularis]|uniref:PPR domain-containing protein/PPR_2 domain-containing protein/PPR_3 domain-containing protein n=1 Tax=Cephalotus follicularis TaxID=3775 RepID=A0A1Q3CVD9_CEPFO|nr:PPR domain-containing protein/PPR_2 domain-containing protein/PPR_3 domain-containing protein [Cephalotus follicularis]
MKNLAIILGSSSVVTPPPNNQKYTTTTKPKPKPPKPKTSLSSSSPQHSISTLHSPSPLFSTLNKPHLNYYAGLASNLAENGRLEDFTMIVDTVVASGGVSACHFVAMVISRNLQEGKVRSVVEVLRSVDSLGVDPSKLFDGGFGLDLVKNECRKIVSCGRMEELVDLMEILAGFHFPIKELVYHTEIIKICVNEHNPKLAIRYAHLLPHAQILYCNIIHEFGKKGDFVSALTAYEASKQHLDGPNMHVYRTIIDVCGLCGNYMKSRYVYEDLLNQNITPNIYVFNSLMNVNARDLSYTLHVYKSMQNLGVTADLASYNILLKACCLAGRVDLAQDIYTEVKHLESTGVLKLDVFTYCTVIKVLADAKLWQMALKIKEDMLSAGVTPNTVTWSSLISACANAGLVEQAIHLFEEMLLAGCEPNSQCCNILLHACVEACQYDRAFRLFHSWNGSTDVEPFGKEHNSNTTSIFRVEHRHEISLHSSPNCVLNVQDLKVANRFSFTPTTTSYNILMKACGTDYYRAKALMDEMRTIGLSPNHISWSILIDICGASGNAEGAIQILGTMRAAGIIPDVIAYTTAIKVCVQSGALRLAFSLFAEMKKYQIQPNLVTYNTLLRARRSYGSLHEVQQCLAIYQEMRKAGYKSNDYFLKQLIEEWCEGAIQGSVQTRGELSFYKRTDLGGPQSQLLEKVAAHLRQCNTQSLAIDLQGLTKVEARIVVLAVLRMIKENYALGDPVKDDMLIILGVQNEEANPGKHKDNVKDVIVKLLQDELGLAVLLVRPKITFDNKTGLEYPFNTDANLKDVLGRNRLSRELLSPTRRPVILQRLKVTRKSLHHWLQRKVSAFRQ